MANIEKYLKTRLKLRYDTYNNWITNNPILLKGEAAVTVVPGTGGEDPAILIKVGDGTSNYTSLPWVSALASDVYDWAKRSTPPDVGDGLDRIGPTGANNDEYYYSLKPSTTSEIGGGKVSNVLPTGATNIQTTSVAGRNFGVQIDADDNYFVNVPGGDGGKEYQLVYDSTTDTLTLQSRTADPLNPGAYSAWADVPNQSFHMIYELTNVNLTGASTASGYRIDTTVTMRGPTGTNTWAPTGHLTIPFASSTTAGVVEYEEAVTSMFGPTGNSGGKAGITGGWVQTNSTKSNGTAGTVKNIDVAGKAVDIEDSSYTAPAGATQSAGTISLTALDGTTKTWNLLTDATDLTGLVSEIAPTGTAPNGKFKYSKIGGPTGAVIDVASTAYDQLTYVAPTGDYNPSAFESLVVALAGDEYGDAKLNYHKYDGTTGNIINTGNNYLDYLVTQRRSIRLTEAQFQLLTDLFAVPSLGVHDFDTGVFDKSIEFVGPTAPTENIGTGSTILPTGYYLKINRVLQDGTTTPVYAPIDNAVLGIIGDNLGDPIKNITAGPTGSFGYEKASGATGTVQVVPNSTVKSISAGTTGGYITVTPIIGSSSSVNVAGSALSGILISSTGSGINNSITGSISKLNGTTGVIPDVGLIASKDYVNAYIAQEIAKVDQFQYVVSTSAATTPNVTTYEGIQGTLVPSADTEFKIYLVLDSTSTTGSYVEWLTIKVGNTYSWEKIGTTSTDLTDYVKRVDVDYGSNSVDTGSTGSVSIQTLPIAFRYYNNAFTITSPVGFEASQILNTYEYYQETDVENIDTPIGYNGSAVPIGADGSDASSQLQVFEQTFSGSSYGGNTFKLNIYAYTNTYFGTLKLHYVLRRTVQSTTVFNSGIAAQTVGPFNVVVAGHTQANFTGTSKLSLGTHVKSGPDSSDYHYLDLNIPAASISSAGVITTGDQSITGNKTFYGDVTFNAKVIAPTGFYVGPTNGYNGPTGTHYNDGEIINRGVSLTLPTGAGTIALLSDIAGAIPQFTYYGPTGAWATDDDTHKTASFTGTTKSDAYTEIDVGDIKRYLHFAIPAASTGSAGVITTSPQNLAGQKNFYKNASEYTRITGPDVIVHGPSGSTEITPYYIRTQSNITGSTGAIQASVDGTTELSIIDSNKAAYIKSTGILVKTSQDALTGIDYQWPTKLSDSTQHLATEEYVDAPTVNSSTGYQVYNTSWTNATPGPSGVRIPFTITVNNTTSATGYIPLPLASASTPGILSTGTQTIAGAKTFGGTVNVGSSATNYTKIDSNNLYLYGPTGFSQYKPGEIDYTDVGANSQTIIKYNTSSNSLNEIQIPAKSGTIALLSDITESYTTLSPTGVLFAGTTNLTGTFYYTNGENGPSGSVTHTIPAASLTGAGVITTGLQSFSGEKKFYGNTGGTGDYVQINSNPGWIYSRQGANPNSIYSYLAPTGLTINGGSNQYSNLNTDGLDHRLSNTTIKLRFATSPTGAYTATVQAKTGTIALLDDIPNVSNIYSGITAGPGINIQYNGPTGIKIQVDSEDTVFIVDGGDSTEWVTGPTGAFINEAYPS